MKNWESLICALYWLNDFQREVFVSLFEMRDGFLAWRYVTFCFVQFTLFIRAINSLTYFSLRYKDLRISRIQEAERSRAGVSSFWQNDVISAGIRVRERKTEGPRTSCISYPSPLSYAHGRSIRKLECDRAENLWPSIWHQFNKASATLVSSWLN